MFCIWALGWCLLGPHDEVGGSVGVVGFVGEAVELGALDDGHCGSTGILLESINDDTRVFLVGNSH